MQVGQIDRSPFLPQKPGAIRAKYDLQRGFHMTGAPGISIKAVLGGAPESNLRAYVGAPTIGVLSALNPELLTRANLVELAALAAEPLEVLRRKDLRAKLIEMVPLAKARELAERLAVRERGSSIYHQLIATADDRRSEPVLMSFFGVVQPERAPSAEEAATKEISPAYGLFPHQFSVAERANLALSEHPFKTVVHMPTGSGKTRPGHSSIRGGSLHAGTGKPSRPYFAGHPSDRIPLHEGT
jgi:DNA repair protein RadD